MTDRPNRFLPEDPRTVRQFVALVLKLTRFLLALAIAVGIVWAISSMAVLGVRVSLSELANGDSALVTAAAFVLGMVVLLYFAGHERMRNHGANAIGPGAESPSTNPEISPNDQGS